MSLALANEACDTLVNTLVGYAHKHTMLHFGGANRVCAICRLPGASFIHRSFSHDDDEGGVFG